MDVAISRFYFFCIFVGHLLISCPFSLSKSKGKISSNTALPRIELYSVEPSYSIADFSQHWRLRSCRAHKATFEIPCFLQKKTGAPSPWPQATCIIAKAIHNSVVCRNFFHNHCHILLTPHPFVLRGVVSCFFMAFMNSARIFAVPICTTSLMTHISFFFCPSSICSQEDAHCLKPSTS